MSSIKLTADSGGGTFEIKAPSSGSNARVLTVPDSASGTVLTTTNPKAGNILQVQSTTLNSAVSAVAAGVTTYADIAGMSVNITPAASSNKILISVHLTYGNDTTTRNDLIKLVKDGSDLTAATGTGSATGRSGIAYARITATQLLVNHSMMHLDTAGGTSQITYKLQWSGEASGTRYLNRRGDSTSYGTISSITAMEIAA